MRDDLTTDTAGEPLASSSDTRSDERRGPRSTMILAWSTLFFSVLQSICATFLALNGMRLVIGISSFAAAALGSKLRWLHQDWIRIPMIVLAVAGAAINLGVLVHARQLRNKPSARWRQKPRAAGKIRMERLEIALGVATLILAGIEESLHYIEHGHL